MTLSDDLARIADDFDFDGSRPHMRKGEVDTLRRASDALRWRRVEDGLPEPNALVLVYLTNFNTGVGRRKADKWEHYGGNSFDQVTHWMPLPPEPRDAT